MTLNFIYFLMEMVDTIKIIIETNVTPLIMYLSNLIAAVINYDFILYMGIVSNINFFFMKMVDNVKIVLELTITLFSVYLPDMTSLIMDNTVTLSIILIILLGFRFIFDGFDDNSVIKFVAAKSIFFIAPLLLIFIGILIYNAMNF